MIEEKLFVRANTDDDERDLAKGEFTSSLNLLPSNQGKGSSPRTETVFGTKAVTATLPTGTNTCIGSIEDRVNNLCYYFLHNSNGDHSIWEYDPSLETTTKILENSNLGFTLENYISRGVVVGGVLYFTDGENEIFSIGVADAKAGSYNSSAQTQMTLIKVPPLAIPTATLSTDTSVTLNKIMEDTFQFAVRYKYKDKAYTPFSPLSKLKRNNPIPDYTSTSAYYAVSYTVPSAERAFIEEIEFAFVKNNDGIYRIFDRQDVASATASYTANFYNTNTLEIVSDEEASKLFSPIPRKSSGLELFKNRLWVIDSLSGYNPLSSVSFNVEETTDATGLATGLDRSEFKEGGRYKFGIVWYDKYGRSSGVTNVQEVQFTYDDALTPLTTPAHIDTTTKKYASWTLVGDAPEWATHYQIVRTNNLVHQTFINCPVNVLFYVRDKGNVDAGAGQFELNERIYLQDEGTDPSPSTGDYSKMHLQLPTNVPLLPEKGWFVRRLHSLSGATGGTARRVEVVQDVLDDEFLVVNPFGEEDFTSVTHLRLFCDIFSTVDDEEETFFEIGELNTISGSISDSGKLMGDVYSIDLDPSTSVSGDLAEFGWWTFNKSGYTTDGSTTRVQYDSKLHTAVVDDGEHYSQAPIYDGTDVSADLTSQTFQNANQARLTLEKVSDVFGTNSSQYKKAIRQFNFRNNVSFTLDYTKVSSSVGRINLVIPDDNEVENANTLMFSGTYVANSNINNLYDFRVLNSYDLPVDRGAIKALAGAWGNTLLAIHEKTTTSLQVGDEVLTTQDGSTALAKTDEVIGTDNELFGGYGTINPESIRTYNGLVWFFDAFNGEVVRYANNGLTPLGEEYKYRAPLATKGDQMRSTSLNKVLIGYEPLPEMVYTGFSQYFAPSETEQYNEVKTASGTEIYNEDKNGASGTDTSPDFDGVTIGNEYKVRIEANGIINPTDRVTLRYGSSIGDIIADVSGLQLSIVQEITFTATETNATIYYNVAGDYNIQITEESLLTGTDTSPTFDGFTSGRAYRVKVTNQNTPNAKDRVRLQYGSGGGDILFASGRGADVVEKEFVATETNATVYYEVWGSFQIEIIEIGTPTGSKETIGFWEQENAWRGNFSFTPDNFGLMNNQMLAWNAGALYIHGQESGEQNKFYGTHYNSEITFVVNDQPSLEKVLQYIMTDSSDAWAVTACVTPEGQDTDLEEDEFVLRDNVYYANFRRDKNTNGDLLSGSEVALLHGNIMKGKTFKITLQKAISSDVPLKELKAVYVATQLPSGQLRQ